MSKNLIPQIAEMLGVELGEEFKIKGYDELIYKFANDGLRFTGDNGLRNFDATANVALTALLNGKDEIVKIPWKPKMYEEYWTFGKLGKQWIVGTLIWKELPYEILLLGKGWVYRTRAEAETALPAVAKEMGVEFIV